MYAYIEFLLESVVSYQTERESVSSFEPVEPLLRCAWASFYMLKGSPTGGNADRGKNVKGVAVGITTYTVHPT